MKRTKKRTKLLILFLCIIVIIGILAVGLKTTKKNTKNTEKENIKEESTKQKNDKDSKKEEKPKVSFYKKEYEERYKAYQNSNPNLTEEQVIVNVNIGLDYNFYENMKPAQHLNESNILVNKYNYLSNNYIPENLVEISTKYALSGMRLVSYAKAAFEQMASAANQEGMTIIAMSTYRSYDYQAGLYNRYVSKDGQQAADTYSARPGHSEHQTGLAADIYNGKVSYTNFENTKEFTWMQENAHKYGFILRYPNDKISETGYQYESWHYRYVGVEIATYIHEHNITYEEYYVRKIEE